MIGFPNCSNNSGNIDMKMYESVFDEKSPITMLRTPFYSNSDSVIKYVVCTYLFGLGIFLRLYFNYFELLKWQKKPLRQKSASVIQWFCFLRRQSRWHCRMPTWVRKTGKLLSMQMILLLSPCDWIPKSFK